MNHFWRLATGLAVLFVIVLVATGIAKHPIIGIVLLGLGTAYCFGAFVEAIVKSRPRP